MSPPSPPVLRVAGAQIENAVGDLDGNAGRIRDAMRWAEGEGADVVVFPELALTGYPLADLVLRPDFVHAAGRVLDELARHSGRTTAVVGTIGRIPPRRSWDTRNRTVTIAAAVLCDGQIRGVYHKVLLPNYELFDEARNFAPGSRPDALWRIGQTVAGISICEDLWSGDGPPEAQAAAGAQIHLVPNASPFHREKPTGRFRLAAEVARRNGAPVVYVNCVGGQDELAFDGGSIVVDADGQLLHRAPQFVPDRFWVDVPVSSPRPVSGQVTTVHARPAPVREPVRAAPPAPQAPADEQTWSALVVGTRDFVRRNGATAAALGLSGGIDAAVTAAIAADALGPENVLALAMPAPDSPDEELEDAEELARRLGIGFEVVELEDVTDVLRRELEPLLSSRPHPVTADQLEARTRTAILSAVCDQLGHLPLATGNKSELSIGSAALFGDLAGTFAPLKDCPKTLVYRLAGWRNLRGTVFPQRTLERPASVQIDETNALPGYEILDPIVERYVEKGQTPADLEAAGFDPAVVRGVLQLIDGAEFKRRQTPPGVKITARAWGQDLRMPISNAWRPFRAEEAELAGPDAPVGSLDGGT